MERLKGLRIVVTGGAGFIGSHLVERLLSSGAEVTIIDNFLFGSKIEHLGKHQALSIIEGDVRDVEILPQVLNAKDIVFHLAACVGVEETQKMPFEVLDVEIQGTLNLLNSAIKSGIKKFIFGSSSEVYGDSPKQMKEDGPLSPKSTYATAKLVGEEYCKAYHQKYGLEYTCLRYFNVYGPRQDERFVIPRFVKKVVSDEPLAIYGDGKQTRDFTYIDDVVKLSLLAAVESKAKCQTINIGTGITTSINELTELISKSLDSKHPVISTYVDYDNTRPRSIETLNRRADISKAIELLRYKPEITLASGIRKYIDWYLQR